MKENNMKAEPLLFIDTVNNNDVIPKNQEIFDSRNKQTIIITKTHPQEFYVKLNRLVLMYNKNKKIICQLVLLTKECFNIIVKKADNNIITCINIDDMREISFNINEVDELTIEQINYY